jgi:excinuclease UvrABC nuclease subunit
VNYKHLPRSSGVYLMTHEVTGDTYVGGTSDLRLPFCGHLSDLRNGSHLNPRMRQLVRDHGLSFRCEVLELVDRKERDAVELRWIASIKPTLNIISPPRAGKRKLAGK